MKFFYVILYFLPKNKLSHLAGLAAQVVIPMRMRNPIFRFFGWIFCVNFYEIKKPLYEFSNLQDFFIRSIKSELRPISKSSIVSPCDGILMQLDKIKDGRLLQIKNKTYHLNKLIGECADSYDNMYCATIYLSPGNYHRFHMPCDGFIRKCRYIPGYLWPVNSWSVKNVDQLFCCNERIIFWINQNVLLVAIGATMVGKIKFYLDLNINSNISNSKIVTKTYLNPLFVKKGNEIGHFEFGSTIILTTPKKLDFKFVGRTIKQGAKI